MSAPPEIHMTGGAFLSNSGTWSSLCISLTHCKPRAGISHGNRLFSCLLSTKEKHIYMHENKMPNPQSGIETYACLCRITSRKWLTLAWEGRVLRGQRRSSKHLRVDVFQSQGPVPAATKPLTLTPTPTLAIGVFILRSGPLSSPSS